MTSLLSVDAIEVVYDQAILAVRSISLNIEEGAIVALLGANGAGKSTTLKAISSLVQAERGNVTHGQIYYQGQDITHASAASLVKNGLVQVLEGRHCFPHLTVEENLLSGAFVKNPSKAELKRGLERIYTYFPRLIERRKIKAGYTSGGEQQMIAIGRALMSDPKLILLDEPSMGLAPKIVDEIFTIIHRLNKDEGTSFLLAEQNIRLALSYADYAYVIENGQVHTHGDAKQLAKTGDIQAAYLGSLASSNSSAA